MNPGGCDNAHLAEFPAHRDGCGVGSEHTEGKEEDSLTSADLEPAELRDTIGGDHAGAHDFIDLYTEADEAVEQDSSQGSLSCCICNTAIDHIEQVKCRVQISRPSFEHFQCQ